MMGKNRGERNGNWKGGIAQYPNHYQMKLNRIKRFKQTKGRCEICGKRANQIHHIDGSKNNHSLKNLLVVCGSCHGNFFRKQHTSKYKREYGLTLKDMAKKVGASTTWIYHKLKTPDGKSEILSQLKKNKVFPDKYFDSWDNLYAK